MTAARKHHLCLARERSPPYRTVLQDLVRATILLAVQHAEEEEAMRGSEAEGGMSGSSTMDAYDNEDERVSGAWECML